MAEIDLDDHVCQEARLLPILQQQIPLEPLPVDPRLAVFDDEGARVRYSLWTGPKIERLTFYTFFAAGRLKEHLFFLWPAAGWDLPAMSGVIMEYGPSALVTSDWLPLRDPVFDPGYYERYFQRYRATVNEWWPRLVAQRAIPDPPPMGYFSQQVGSVLAVVLMLQADAVPLGLDYQAAVVEAWAAMWADAEPVAPEAVIEAEARRERLIRHTYKRLDYRSAAAGSLAKSIGWERTNLLFDHVFGPDAEPRPLDVQRHYDL